MSAMNLSEANTASSNAHPPSDGAKPGSGNGEAPDLVRNVAQGAHQAIDQLAEQVTPHVQRLQDGMSSAGQMLDERADQLRNMGDAWMGSLRTTVRDNPLTALATALALGVLVARLSR
jgi:ElaB/YqjD/DUF883 family membrane-anchored ribosome-binding protein